MKKIFIIVLIVLLSPLTTFAVNGDLYITKFVQFTTIGTNEYIIPDGYDLFVEKATITHLSGTNPPGTEAILNVYDSGSLVFSGGFPEGQVIQDNYDIVFRDTLFIDNINDHELNILYSGYLFREGSYINHNGNETLIDENGSIKKEYEFLRQEELYNFYELEFTFLLFYALIVIAPKFTPGNIKKGKKYMF